MDLDLDGDPELVTSDRVWFEINGRIHVSRVQTQTVRTWENGKSSGINTNDLPYVRLRSEILKIGLWGNIPYLALTGNKVKGAEVHETTL